MIMLWHTQQEQEGDKQGASFFLIAWVIRNSPKCQINWEFFTVYDSFQSELSASSFHFNNSLKKSSFNFWWWLSLLIFLQWQLIQQFQNLAYTLEKKQHKVESIFWKQIRNISLRTNSQFWVFQVRQMSRWDDAPRPPILPQPRYSCH